MKKLISFLSIIIFTIFLTACTTIDTGANINSVTETTQSNDLLNYYGKNINTFLEEVPGFELSGSEDEFSIYIDENETTIMTEEDTIKFITILSEDSPFNIAGIAINDSISEAQTILEDSDFTVTLIPGETTGIFADSSEYPNTEFDVFSTSDKVDLIMVSDTELAYLLSSVFGNEQPE